MRKTAAHTQIDHIIYRIVHDLRGSIRAISELPGWIQQDLEDEGIVLTEGPSASMALLKIHSKKLNTMLDQLSEYARTAYRVKEQVCLNSCLQQAVLGLSLPEGTRVRGCFQPDFMYLDKIALRTIFQLLISNAAQDIGKPKRIALLGRIENNHWELTLRDPSDWFEQTRQTNNGKDPRSARPNTDNFGMGLGLLEHILAHASGTIDALQHSTTANRSALVLRLPISPTS